MTKTNTHVCGFATLCLERYSDPQGWVGESTCKPIVVGDFGNILQKTKAGRPRRRRRSRKPTTHQSCGFWNVGVRPHPGQHGLHVSPSPRRIDGTEIGTMGALTIYC